mmetsp:Transcript_7869/g.32395  ORF Transcript_7869/g.32395 Transcript_7869/m.32395 type:complete len:309 (+) Transcript_7869:497-1423(+)
MVLGEYAQLHRAAPVLRVHDPRAVLRVWLSQEALGVRERIPGDGVGDDPSQPRRLPQRPRRHVPHRVEEARVVAVNDPPDRDSPVVLVGWSGRRGRRGRAGHDHVVSRVGPIAVDPWHFIGPVRVGFFHRRGDGHHERVVLVALQRDVRRCPGVRSGILGRGGRDYLVVVVVGNDDLVRGGLHSPELGDGFGRGELQLVDGDDLTLRDARGGARVVVARGDLLGREAREEFLRWDDHARRLSDEGLQVADGGIRVDLDGVLTRRRPNPESHLRMFYGAHPRLLLGHPLPSCPVSRERRRTAGRLRAKP